MFVSRTAATTARTSPSGCVVGGWLLALAAVGGFAFAAGDNMHSSTQNPVPTPVVATTPAPTNSQISGSAVTVYLPTRVGALSDGRVTAAVNAPVHVQPHPTDIACRLTERAGLTVSRVHAPDRAVRSSNSRGPASMARVSATACRLATANANATKPAIKAASAISGR
jgi:hypothetical protein